MVFGTGHMVFDSDRIVFGADQAVFGADQSAFDSDQCLNDSAIVQVWVCDPCHTCGIGFTIGHYSTLN